MDYSHLAILLLLSCSCSTPTLLLPKFYPALAVLLPCFFQAPIRDIPSSSPVPAQLLPSFCLALLYSAQLSSAPAPFLPCSCFSPTLALLLPYSRPAHPAHGSLAALIIIIIVSTLRLFSARREPPFMVNYRRFNILSIFVHLSLIS